jgi:serine/threonine protein kinase
MADNKYSDAEIEALFAPKPEKLWPDKYLFVSTAGTAKGSDPVRFCIPEDVVPAIDPEVTVATTLSAIKSKVVAIKTLQRKHIESIGLLQKTEQYAPLALRRNLAQFISSEEVSKTSNFVWLVTEAVIPNITVTNFRHAVREINKGDEILRTPALEFFLQIGPVLKFLHEDQKITHNDLKSDNVLVTLEHGREGRTLRFVLSDFEESTKMKGSTALMEEDVWSFCNEASELIGPTMPSDAEAWDSFVNTMKYHEKGDNISQLMERCENLAMGLRQDRTEGDNKVIAEAMELAKKETRDGELDEALRNVLAQKL